MCCFRNNNREQLTTLPGPHSILFNLVKSAQPMLAILRGVLQKKKRNRRHGVSDVADMPFAAAPQRAEVGGLLLWIITFAGLQLIKLDRDWRGQPARCCFLQDPHAAVIMRISPRR